MMTREELQDQNDELRLELERAREAAELVKLRQEVKELREEVAKLKKDLEASERQRSQLQGELDTLNEASNNARESHREGKERLLGKMSDLSSETAAAHKRWEAEKAELLKRQEDEKAELQEKLDKARAEAAQQKTRAENHNKQVFWQLEEMAKLRRALESAGPVGAAEEIALKDKEIKSLRDRIWKLQEEARLRKQLSSIELAVLVGSRPGLVLAIMFLIGIAALLLSRVS
jgi:chromosome segregation ATPase